MRIKSAFSEREPREFALRCEDPSLARQSFKEECDINTIVKRFGLSGELPKGVRMPSYGDFTGIYDYASAMNAIVAARESFDTMPANVRARFNNEPADFVAFCSDDRNRDEAVKLGLVPAAAVVPPVPSEPIVAAPEVPPASKPG